MSVLIYSGSKLGGGGNGHVARAQCDGNYLDFIMIFAPFFFRLVVLATYIQRQAAAEDRVFFACKTIFTFCLFAVFWLGYIPKLLVKHCFHNARAEQ